MKSFSEYLNDQPNDLKSSWDRVEGAWEAYLQVLHDHLRDNMAKYDAYHSKFGNLSSEHPDHYLEGLVRGIEKDFTKMKEALIRLGAHHMV